jgi:hypothetical protein
MQKAFHPKALFVIYFCALLASPTEINLEQTNVGGESSGELTFTLTLLINHKSRVCSRVALCQLEHSD